MDRPPVGSWEEALIYKRCTLQILNPKSLRNLTAVEPSPGGLSEFANVEDRQHSNRLLLVSEAWKRA
jgi:hypothetical protein